MLVDATETPIESPEKRHTIKSQFIVAKETQEIICTDFSNRKRHGFRLFKEFKVRFHAALKVINDTGY